MKPVAEYTVIGKSFKNSITSSKVTAKETWVDRRAAARHAARAHGASENARLDA